MDSDTKVTTLYTAPVPEKSIQPVHPALSTPQMIYTNPTPATQLFFSVEVITFHLVLRVQKVRSMFTTKRSRENTEVSSVPVCEQLQHCTKNGHSLRLTAQKHFLVVLSI